jgi:hypothetical protein
MILQHVKTDCKNVGKPILIQYKMSKAAMKAFLGTIKKDKTASTTQATATVKTVAQPTTNASDKNKK